MLARMFLVAALLLLPVTAVQGGPPGDLVAECQKSVEDCVRAVIDYCNQTTLQCVCLVFDMGRVGTPTIDARMQSVEWAGIGSPQVVVRYGSVAIQEELLDIGAGQYKLYLEETSDTRCFSQ